MEIKIVKTVVRGQKYKIRVFTSHIIIYKFLNLKCLKLNIKKKSIKKKTI